MGNILGSDPVCGGFGVFLCGGLVSSRFFKIFSTIVCSKFRSSGACGDRCVKQLHCNQSRINNATEGQPLSVCGRDPRQVRRRRLCGGCG